MHRDRAGQVASTFRAQLYVQLLFVGGALDADLAAASAEFPLDETGSPTFRPSASWCLQRLSLSGHL